MTTVPVENKSFPSLMAFMLIFCFLSAGIITAGYYFYENQKKHIIKTQYEELGAIADLKVGQIINWRKERFEDAGVIMDNPIIADYVREFIERRQPFQLRKEIIAMMTSLKGHQGYRNIFLLDRKGRVILSVGGESRQLSPYVFSIIMEAMRDRKVVLSDLHSGKTADDIHLDIITPLLLRRGNDKVVVGAFLLQIDPYHFFFPHIQSWPTLSKTAETLLVRREGNDVLYLNELRYRKNTALSLRLPLNKPNLPAAMAVAGQQGIVEGFDYRGVRVLASLKPVTDSQCFLVAKIDAEEVYAPIRERAWIFSILIIVMIVAAGSGISFLWRRQSIIFYRTRYEAELKHLAEHKEFEKKLIRANRLYAVLSQINQAIVRIRDRGLLFQEMCRIAVEYGDFKMVWIGLVDNDTAMVNPAAYSGFEEGYLENIKISIKDEPEGRGPTGIAIRENRCFVCSDIHNNPIMLPWREAAVKRGYSSSAAVPIRMKDTAIGAFNVYSTEPDFFDSEEIRLIEEIADDISYALANFEREEARKIAEEDREKLEAQFRQSQKMEAVGLLAGGIAHDFNNMLTAIIGFGRLLQMNIGSDDAKKGYLNEIIRAADNAGQLTKQLLAFGRRQIINPAPVDLNDIVNNMKMLLGRIIGEDIEIKTVFAEKDLTIRADRGQIEQVLMNLATNARDAMPKGGILTIETEKIVLDEEFIRTHDYGRPGAYALISITDTGTGMAQKTKERIFEPFFTTKELGKGTGLGLAVVYGIINQHDGYINVYSEPGKGTTFKIYIPETPTETEHTQAREATLLKGGTETILLADDDDKVRLVTKALLENFGYKVIDAVDGKDAVEKFERHKDDIQLVILDVVMPVKNGREAYEEIRKAAHNIKVLFSSGYPMELIQKEGLIEQGLHFISKPIQPSELLKKIREILTGRMANGRMDN